MASIRYMVKDVEAAMALLEVDNLPSLVEQMKLAGVPFRNEIVTGPGGRQILIEDPSGNPIELFEPGR